MLNSRINLDESTLECEYKVLYAKSGAKKRKSYSDGTLIVRKAPGGVSNQVVLYSEERSEVFKMMEKNTSNIKVGLEIEIGPFTIQIDDVMSGDTSGHSPPQKVQILKPSLTIRQFAAPKATSARTVDNVVSSKILDAKWEREDDVHPYHGNKENVNNSSAPVQSSAVRFKPVVTPSGHICESSLFGGPVKMESKSLVGQAKVPELDPSLTRVMREHQVVGAHFLLSRLEKGDIENGRKDNVDSEEEGDENVNYRREVLRDTGAILADEMGVGKTLTTLAVVWAFARREICKSVIITPSSLVENWAKEIKHWLGVKLTPLIVKPGADAVALINTFSISRVSRYPVLILSYEMFRKHAGLMNTVTGLELMVCDEGHRLKNIGGTKTIEALNNCKAFRRIVLSGTPIQNDLDELYSVVNFVVPGYLGSLPDYKRYIATPITNAADTAAGGGGETGKKAQKAADKGESASRRLRSLLSRIMLRRTQNDILKKILPPRRDYVVYCGMTANQQQEYAAVASAIKRTLGLDEHSGLFDEAIVHNTAAVPSNVILPGLQQLRQICNIALGSSVGVGDLQHAWASASGMSTASLGGAKTTPYLLANSTKLQFISRFLAILRSVSPDEKVVIVSNFTTVLDKIEQLLQNSGFGGEGRVLRLDGKVPVDLRQNLVNRFNRADDPSAIFLLSSKAGGVGINLIGGSRLIMCDVDWNPAIDHQAMSRIWREGQKRETHVYRLVAAECIEDAILQRQRSKNDLAVLVQKDDGGPSSGVPAENDDEVGMGDQDIAEGLPSRDSVASNLAGFGEKRMSLTRKDILLLMYPNLATASGLEAKDSGTQSDRSRYGKDWFTNRANAADSEESSPDSDLEDFHEKGTLAGVRGAAGAGAAPRMDPSVADEVLRATVEAMAEQDIKGVTKVK